MIHRASFYTVVVAWNMRPGVMVEADTILGCESFGWVHGYAGNDEVWIMYKQMKLVYLGIMLHADIVDL